MTTCICHGQFGCLFVNKVLRTAIVISATVLSPQASASGPTSYFNQELAAVAPGGTIQIDLRNQGNTQVRMGVFSGEAIVDLNSDTLLYKMGISDPFALYGGLGITTDPSGTATTTLVFGAAYTYRGENLIFNVNPVMSNVGADSRVDVNLGLYVPLSPGKSYPGRLLPGISVYAPVTPSADATVLLGLRWEVKANVTLEAGLYNSSNGLQFPGLFRINLVL